jgi:beta-lactamase class A
MENKLTKILPGSVSLILFLVFSAQSQTPELQKMIQKAITGFNGKVGVYVEHLNTGEKVSINADSIFPTASIVKVPIMVGIYSKINEEKLYPEMPLLYRDSISYGGSGLMQFFKDSTLTDLQTLLSLMIGYSDNTTSLWCQNLAGTGTRINEIMETLDLRHTRVNSRTPGRKDYWKKYGWGQTTPREMSNLMVKIRRGEIFNMELSEEMYRLMTNVVYDDYALSALPANVQAASKQGMVNASRSELVLVNAPGGD